MDLDYTSIFDPVTGLETIANHLRVECLFDDDNDSCTSSNGGIEDNDMIIGCGYSDDGDCAEVGDDNNNNSNNCNNPSNTNTPKGSEFKSEFTEFWPKTKETEWWPKEHLHHQELLQHQTETTTATMTTTTTTDKKFKIMKSCLKTAHTYCCLPSYCISGCSSSSKVSSSSSRLRRRVHFEDDVVVAEVVVPKPVQQPMQPMPVLMCSAAAAAAAI